MVSVIQKLTPTKTLIAQLQKAIQGGLRIFQYRDKDLKIVRL